jgi:hypothetical protein
MFLKSKGEITNLNADWRKIMDILIATTKNYICIQIKKTKYEPGRSAAEKK